MRAPGKDLGAGDRRGPAAASRTAGRRIDYPAVLRLRARRTTSTINPTTTRPITT